MFYLFKNGKCETLCEDKLRLEELTQDEDTTSTIVEDDRWLNPSDLSLVEGKVKVNAIIQTTEEIKAAKLTSLDNEYQPQFAALAQSLGLATLDGDKTVIAGIKEDYVALKAQYQTEKGDIENG